ncbi:MAG: DUF4381 family protein [Pseudomonadota bacterium]
MTPEEILRDLRDIHTPLGDSAQFAPTFATWPFLVLAGCLAAIWVVRWARRTRWRREASAKLGAIDAIADPAARFDAMIKLLRQVARQQKIGRPPEAVFRAHNLAEEHDAASLREHLREALGR